jgi:3-oxoadipate enol-lactonase
MMAVVDLDGSRFRYELEGPEAAPVLMLSNSLGADLSMWDPQMPGFTRRLRVLRYDTRGHGGSSVTPGPYTVERLGRDALALLDALGIERAHFCGLSLGGATGMWLALNAPERLDKLVLCNTAAQFGTPEVWNTRIEAVRQGGTAAIAQGVMERWFTERFRRANPEPVEAIRKVLLGTLGPGYIACSEAVRDVDLRDAIGAIRTPTLVIAGTHDPATPPAAGRLIAERIEGARYVELDAAHLSNIEAPEEFTRTVLEFLGANGNG